jgi:hypothetical protein
MRRKATTQIREAAEFDLKRDVDPDIIWGIGAACLLWNTIESIIDASLALAADIPPPLWTSILSRINGVDGKISAIKEACQLRLKMPSKIYDPISKTLGGIEEHKKYRDALIHARMLDPKQPVAPTFQRRGEEWEVLVTKDAIMQLFRRLGFLRDEIEAALLLFHYTKIWNQSRGIDEARREAEDEMSKQLTILSRHQYARLKLPPLPKFPDTAIGNTR